jgi:ribose transport system permease protein
MPMSQSVQSAVTQTGSFLRRVARRYSGQSAIVTVLTAILMAAFGLAVPGFMSIDNLFSLLQNVAILGILSLGMGIVVIGRGIDLAVVATMAISVGWVLNLVANGESLTTAIAYGFCFAILVGIIQGILIAYAEIPAIFATLAMSLVIYGFGRIALVAQDVEYVPDAAVWFHDLAAGSLFFVPKPVIAFAVVALLVTVLLRTTALGRIIYAMGDNPPAARLRGLPVRPMTILLYSVSSGIAFVAGLLTAALVSNINIRVVNSSLVYDVILVVVLGGIGLSGGKGSVRNVVVGALLIGTLLNGMTLLNAPYEVQNIVKGIVLLFAIIIDAAINPRDEQTAQHGDI